jgi:hypothetical protein
MSLLTSNNLISKPIFTSQAVTLVGVVSSVMNIEGANQLQLLVNFTAGSSTGVLLKVEYSENQIDWYQETMADFLSSTLLEHLPITRKITSTSKAKIALSVSSSYVRVTATALNNETGVVISITATAANI